MSSVEKISMDDLGVGLDCDKSSIRHNYLEHYEELIGMLRGPIRILEIGVCAGKSMALWGLYFPEAAVVGVDIKGDDMVNVEIPKNVTILRGDQGSAADLDHVAAHGPFDVIIDDGSHRSVHQIGTFRRLFKFVRPRGYYFIEDLECACRAKYMKGAKMSILDFLANLQSDMHLSHLGQVKRRFLGLTPKIESMHICGGMVAIRRRREGRGRP